MGGEPEDVPGECNARVFIADNHGDNHVTMRCQLSLGHKGRHRETFGRVGNLVHVAWKKDERFDCPIHGLQSDDWACPICEAAPVLCAKHGLQDTYFCAECEGGDYACPEHGPQRSDYCEAEGCEHCAERDLWTRVFPSP